MLNGLFNLEIKGGLKLFEKPRRALAEMIAGRAFAEASPREDKIVKKGLQKESAASVSRMESVSGFGVENPYGLFQTKGVEIVEQMMRDETFGTFIEVKKSAAVSVKWDIVPQLADDKKQIEIAECVKAAYDLMPGSVIDSIGDMYNAIESGYSVTNIVYSLMEYGDFKGKIGLKYLKTKDPAYVRFDLDPYMNIKPRGIVFTGPDGRDEHLWLDEFVVYSYRMRYGNPYGYGDALRAYDRWNSKTWVNKFWDIYLERMGTGAIIMQYDADNKPSEEEFTVANSFIENKQARSGLTISKNWEIELHEPTAAGGIMFEKAVVHRNKAIARALFIPDQIGYTEESGGSFAKAKVSINVFLWPLEKLHRDMEEIHNEQIIRRLVDMNYGPQAQYPRFKFDPLTEEQKLAWLTNIFTALEKGAIKYDLEIENTVRKALELSEREEDEEEKAGGSPPLPPGDEPDDKVPSLDDLGDDIEAIPSQGKLQLRYSNIAQGFVSGVKRPLSRFEKRVKWDEIEAFLNEAEEGFVDVWSKQMQANQNSIINFIRKTGVIPAGDAVQADKLKLSKTIDQRKTLQRYMLASTYFGALQAQEELKAAKAGSFEVGDLMRFAAVDFNKLPVTEIEKYFESKGLVLSSEIRAAASVAKRKGFWITNIENEKILSKAKQIIYNGIDRSDQVWAEKELGKMFNGYLKTGQIVDGKLGQAYRLEVIARNNFTTATSQGRKAVFEDPDIADFVVAYQWSAVLDDATTPYCWKMDAGGNGIYTKEEINAEGWPPAHHNCRSMVVPVTDGEPHKIKKMPKQDRASGFNCCNWTEAKDAE